MPTSKEAELREGLVPLWAASRLLERYGSVTRRLNLLTLAVSNGVLDGLLETLKEVRNDLEVSNKALRSWIEKEEGK